MKTKIIIALLAIFSLSIITSCSTSNNVVSKHRIQKRKYNKGFYTSPNHKTASISQKDNKNVVKTIEEIKSPTEITSKKGLKAEQNQEYANETKQSPLKNKTANKKASKTTENNHSEISQLKPEKKSKLKTITKIKDKVNQAKSQLTKKSPVDSDVMLVILVILAIILPPLAVFIFEEVTTRFWIDLILWLVGIGVAGILFGGSLAALGGLIAIIYALLIVLDII